MRNARGALAVLGEAITPREGFSPGDPDWARYLAMAEELDIPPGIQIGATPPGTPSFFATAKYADQYGDPLVLAKSADSPSEIAPMRCTGWPHVKGVLALMSTHSQLCVDISVIDWYLPREEFDKYLRPLGRSRLRKTNHVPLRRD